MKKLRILLVACVVSATSLLFTAPSAQAFTCDDDINDACQVAATVVCQIIAKGRPCLY